MRKKKPIILAIAILLAITTAVGASTFAWFTANEEVINRVKTSKFSDGDVTIWEAFDPEDRLSPGGAINKDVSAANTGDSPALVRISFKEALKMLAYGTGGDLLLRTAAPYDSTAAGAAARTPVLVNIDAYDSTWLTFVYGDGTIPPSIPYYDTASETALKGEFEANGVILRYKLTTDAATGLKKYAFAAYVPMGTVPETYQRVEIRQEMFNMVRIPGLASPPDFGLKVDLVDPNYGVTGATWLYNAENGRFYNYLEQNWANSGNPYLASWWDDSTAAFTAPPTSGPAAYSDGTYMSFAAAMGAMTDPHAAPDYIQLIFHNANLATAATTANLGKWYYNATDGFFYYLGLLEPGEAAPMLLDEIYLSKDANGLYSNLSFDLTVCMNAIQATKAAVSDSAGWNLPVAAGSLGALLQSFCAE